MRHWMIAVILICLFFPEAGLSDIYYWVDDQGIQNYTATLESVPEEYRSKAQLLSLPPAPPAPPELDPRPALWPDENSFLPRLSCLGGCENKRPRAHHDSSSIPAQSGTIISPAAQSRLGLSLENAPPVTLKSVTGTDYANRVWVEFIEVGETRVGPLLVVVYEADLKGADGLLGRDFLSHLNVTIDSKEKVITLTPN